MKKVIFVIMFLILVNSFLYDSIFVLADVSECFVVYDTDNNFLFEKDDIQIGDNYLSKNYDYYEIISIDYENNRGVARFLKKISPPKIDKSIKPMTINVSDRTICLYMTHNDESYVPSDGYDSVYGNGGIKDVALAFKKELENNSVDVYFDDTLHIPHDTKAYQRSYKTAKNLHSKYSPDAIFDIHRDGASRKYYVANVGGKERGKVRIVVGKANPNMKLNEEFAIYLMAVANEKYPWLFTDIYYARGHYNQALDSKSLLFEMGSHMIEKELEIESMKELADVVTLALFDTTINEDTNDLTINGVVDENNVIVNESLDKKENKKIKVFVSSFVIGSIFVIGLSSFLILIFVKNKNKK